ncbi:MAG: phage tail tube protein [Firmicutes bacterium]|nr:phage tail tube protein [Bacillota bacterium]
MSKKFFKENEIMNGSGGFVWWGGRKLAVVRSFEAKITGSFEDIELCGDNATYSMYNGYSGEGTLTLLKIDSEILREIAEAYQSGVMPDISIVSAHQQRGTNKVERIAFLDVTITELMLAKFEKKATTEEEIPFKFGNFEVLETI